MREILRHLVVLSLAMFLLISFGICLAKDDAPSHWAVDEINRAKSLDLIPTLLLSQYGDAITREEFASLVHKALGVIEPTVSENLSLDLEPELFTDTDNESVLFCANLGIVDGYGDGTFHPLLNIERQAAAKMLYVAAYVTGNVPVNQDKLHVFSDSNVISTWASSSVNWAYEADIMRGTGENKFKPSSSYTREQAILTMLRLYDYVIGTNVESVADRTISCNDGSISIYNQESVLPGGTLQTRSYSLNNGDQVVMGSYVNNGASSSTTLVAQYSTSISSGQLKYYDSTNETWVTSELKAGSYTASMICVLSDSVNYFVYTPRAWKVHENSTLEAKTDGNGFLYVRKGPNGFILELYAYNLPNNHRSDFTFVTGYDQPLIDWTHRNAENLWKNYTLAGDGKWCYDGYYFPAPTTYIPTGPNFYYRLPAAYLLRSFLAVQSAHRVAQDLALCMMDTILLQQNSEGFFPTISGSTWLAEDYKIMPGFYDTRFNTDFMELLIRGYILYGGDIYLESIQRYADFFLDYASDHHRTTPSGGWYVDDYYHPSGNLSTHTSLNHQLAEIILLYKLSDVLTRSDLSGLADRMLLAIEDSGKDWVRSDKNLHYSKHADGSYGGNDYPYLTYNDMYNLQALLKARTGRTNSTLTMLMDYKKSWMDANKVTDYLK